MTNVIELVSINTKNGLILLLHNLVIFFNDFFF